MTKISFDKIPKTVICYAIILVGVLTGVFFAVGRETLLVYAAESKPFAILFSDYSQQGFVEHNKSFKVICFGDSNYFYPPDKKPSALNPKDIDVHMPGLIKEELMTGGLTPEPVFVEWAYAGASMLDYYCLLYKALKIKPDLVIIPINWRSFSEIWICEPKYYHPELFAFVPLDSGLPTPYEDPIRAEGITTMRHIELKIDMLFLYRIGFSNWFFEIRQTVFGKEGAYKSDKEIFDQWRVLVQGNKQAKDKGPGRGTDKEPSYMWPMNISNENKTLKRMCSLAYIASQHDVAVLFYIWPIDLESLTRDGKLERSAFDDSKEIIAEATEAHLVDNIFFVDLSELLSHEDFHDIYGHCTIGGRKKIAQALAPKIADMIGPTSAFDR